MRYLGIALTHIMAACLGACFIVACMAVVMHDAIEVPISAGHSVMCIPLK